MFLSGVLFIFLIDMLGLWPFINGVMKNGTKSFLRPLPSLSRSGSGRGNRTDWRGKRARHPPKRPRKLAHLRMRASEKTSRSISFRAECFFLVEPNRVCAGALGIAKVSNGRMCWKMPGKRQRRGRACASCEREQQQRPTASSAASSPSFGDGRAHAYRAGWRRRGVTMEDEEVAESWEEAADSGEIDRRLEKKLKITQKESSRKSKSPPKVPIVIQDDSLPTGPPPQIRILKRPTSNGVLSNPNSASRPAFPVKSLAQREAEYAEARKRILGSASPEEEEQDKPILDRPTRITQPEEARLPSNVIRQPLGPDGSHGFKQRR